VSERETKWPPSAPGANRSLHPSRSGKEQSEGGIEQSESGIEQSERVVEQSE